MAHPVTVRMQLEQTTCSKGIQMSVFQFPHVALGNQEIQHTHIPLGNKDMECVGVYQKCDDGNLKFVRLMNEQDINSQTSNRFLLIEQMFVMFDNREIYKDGEEIPIKKRNRPFLVKHSNPLEDKDLLIRMFRNMPKRRSSQFSGSKGLIVAFDHIDLSDNHKAVDALIVLKPTGAVMHNQEIVLYNNDGKLEVQNVDEFRKRKIHLQHYVKDGTRYVYTKKQKVEKDE